MQLQIQSLWHIWEPESSYLAGFVAVCWIKAVGKDELLLPGRGSEAG